MKHLKTIVFALIAVAFCVSPAFSQVKPKPQKSEAFQKMERKMISLRMSWLFEELRNCKEVKLKDKAHEALRARYIKNIEASINGAKKYFKKDFKQEEKFIKQKKLNLKGIWHLYHLQKKLFETTVDVLQQLHKVISETKLVDKAEVQIQKRTIASISNDIKIFKMRVAILAKKIKKLK